jgi:hypothetical protein
MYCPGCGSEERQMSQYCRACGTDLRTVRVSLERPDSVTASAVTAREEIGLAVAAKIREVENSRSLRRVADHLLPQMEKFLESPEEKRLRRMRAGVITASVGLGVGIPALFLLTFAGKGDDAFPFLAMAFLLSVVTFMIGLGLVINGTLLSKPRKKMKDTSADAESQNHLDAGYVPNQLKASTDAQLSFRSQSTADLAKRERRAGSSITEHTTHHLKTEQ